MAGVCSHCSGAGFLDTVGEREKRACWFCGGSGKTPVCNRCRGTGKLMRDFRSSYIEEPVPPLEACPDCNGSGTI